MALLLPLTFGMEPTSGIIMLAALYAGTMYGGTITSVLINTPGESASVVTCIDGHQMALQGRAGPALGIAAIGSFIAGTFGVVLLMLVSPLLARWSLSFGPPETFALMLVGLTTVTLLTGESAIKGYISMLLGLMLAMVGFDIVSGEPRFAFGIPEMMDGIDFLPVAIGLFGLGEVLAGAEEAKGKSDPARPLRPARRAAERASTGRAAAGRSPAARCSASSSASCPAPGRPSRPSSPTRWRRRSRSTPRSSARARSRAWPAPSRPTTPRPPGRWCRC